jgi:predicted N-acyltransferase
MSYRVSNDLNDFELFYYRMYMPHTRIKFDNQAYIASYEVMKGYFKKGFLLLISAEGQDIAGALCLKDDDVMFFRDQGVLDGSEVYVKRGVQYAIYYFIIHYAWENGFKTLDTMKSRSCLNDGVYKTKRDWGATVYADYESNASVYYMVPRFSETISAYFNNNPAIINEEDGLYGLAGWPEGHDITVLFKKYFSPGLKGLIVLSPSGGKMKVAFDEVGTQSLL